MYEAYWDLRESPFRNVCRQQYFFASATHEEALARLHFLVDQRRPLGVLSGADGSGKSLTLGILAHELRRKGCRVVQQNLTGINGRALLFALAESLHTQPIRQLDDFSLWRLWEDGVTQLDLQGLTTVVLLDDADQAGEETISLIRRMVKVQDGQIVVLLAAEAARLACLGDLSRLVDLHVQLEPWDEHETIAFLKHSLEKAGGDRNLFDELAANRLHELAQGIPRQVCQLADLALIAGVSQRLHNIDWSTIESVFHELGMNAAEQFVSLRG